MAVDIIYETHALTTDNETGHATGWLPGRLSATGRRLARALGERRRTDAIAAVFVSDLNRAVETAELAFASSGMPVYQDVRLRECNYGALNGMPVAQLTAERARHIDAPYPGGQSYRQVVEAMRAFLRELAAQWDGSRVLIISHSANKWALDCLLCGAVLEELVDAPFGWQEGWRYVLPTGWSDERVTPPSQRALAAQPSEC
jgi:alpha-ribazole phosphatase/probable phosphoglycerate mutase